MVDEPVDYEELHQRVSTLATMWGVTPEHGFYIVMNLIALETAWMWEARRANPHEILS